MTASRTPSHTPGPWATHQWFPCVVVPASDVHKAIGGCVDPDREAEQYAKQIAAKTGGEYPAFHRSRVMPGEAEANARLIAAAPELLIACEVALNDRMFKDWPEVATLLKNAIAKARCE